jgi:hypothetical protein
LKGLKFEESRDFCQKQGMAAQWKPGCHHQGKSGSSRGGPRWKEGKIAAPSLSFFSATTIPLKTRKAGTKLQSDGIQYSNALKNATKTCEK